MRVLVVNAGSSSLKLSVVDGDRALTTRDLDAQSGRFDQAALHATVLDAGGVDAIGHRFVHGGEHHVRAVRLDAEVLADLERLTPLAPLHQPAALHAAALVAHALPGIPAYACFDTAFHATLPAAARTYAIPAEWRERFGIRRFGFHGLSHAYIARRAPELVGRDGAIERLVSCHLGAGASLAAVRRGASVDTTMGFTPLEGLVMATRAGSVDPGALLHLQRTAGIDADAMLDALDRRSGLLALAGTGDMREVLRRRAAGDAAASLAVDVYVHRLAAGIAAMTAALGGLDVLAFTGGVGENAGEVRAAAAERLGHLGVRVDTARNAAAHGDTDISSAGAPARTVVVAAREDLEVAREVRALRSADEAEVER